MEKKFDTVTYLGGPLQGASVLVQNYSDSTTATIYSDDGVTAATNPLTTDANGFFEYYAADGRYKWVISGTGYTTRTITDILHEDPVNANAATFTTLTATGQVSLGGAAGSEGLRVANTASAVNYLKAAGATTGGSPYLLFDGSDTDVVARYRTKGAGTHVFETGAQNNIQFRVGHVASAVNYLQPMGSATGGPVILSAQGSDTNIDISLTPNGSGVLRFGTHSAIAAETVTGYVTIKDSGGTSRKIAVVS